MLDQRKNTPSTNILLSCSNSASDTLQPHLNLGNELDVKTLKSCREDARLPFEAIQDQPEDSDCGSTTSCSAEESESSDSDGGILLDYQLIGDHETLLPTGQARTETEFTLTAAPASSLNTTTLLPSHSHRDPRRHYDSQYSTASLFLLAKTRKYAMPSRAEPALVRSQRPSASVTDITNAVRNMALGTNSHREMSPRATYSRDLLHLTLDPLFLAECEESERRNSFPGVNMNIGWNRARCKLLMHFQDAQGSVEERAWITEGFQRFDLWRQLEPIVLDEDKVKMFDKVFVGCGYGQLAWARTPGSWWAARRGLFGWIQGILSLERLNKRVSEIMERVDEWREGVIEVESGFGGVKRKWWQFADENEEILNPVSKKLKICRRKSEQVMSEAWRARRRLQEKKAGRWTDGTVRMDMLWAAFHWVLNMDDVRDAGWGADFGGILEVSGNDIWEG